MTQTRSIRDDEARVEWQAACDHVARAVADTPAEKKIEWKHLEQILKPGNALGWMYKSAGLTRPVSDDLLKLFRDQVGVKTWWPDIQRADDHLHVCERRRREMYPRKPETHFEVIAIGADNVDHILQKFPATKEGEERLRLAMSGVDVEVVLDDERHIDELIKAVVNSYIGADRHDVFLHTQGGSSRNMLRALACAGASEDFAFIGVSGRSIRRAGISYDLEIEGLIDTSLTYLLEDCSVGRCVSVAQRIVEGSDLQREMGVWPGANRYFSRYVSDRFWELVDTCVAARFVHATSLFDESSPRVLADLFQAVRNEQSGADSRSTCLTFDPGTLWLSDKTTDQVRVEVRRLLGLADILFVSQSELRQAAQNYAGFSVMGGSEDEWGEALRRRFKNLTVVVVKLPGATKIFGPSGRSVVSGVLLDEQVDDTGAGDLFAAGFIHELLKDETSYKAGCRRGMQLAAAKLRVAGPLPVPRMKELFATSL